MGDYRVIEHTADVGIEATGETLEELFQQAALGLLEITASFDPALGGDTVAITVESHDLGALLVDWLSEVLYLQDARDAVVTALDVRSVTPHTAEGGVSLKPRGEDIEGGTPVKAITYHQLSIERTDAGWSARVFFDI